MDITEIQDELLRLEYPNLLPDHDPDIERYYYLRSMGQSMDAMQLYQNRLRVRYPEDEFRTWLLRSYRSHDPAFRSLLAKGYRMLGARSLERVKQIIFFIAERADSYNEKDVYSTIKTAEDILQFLPKERYEAVAAMERFFRYAGALNLKVESIAKATELVRAYLTDTLSVVEEERRRRADLQRQMAEEARDRLVKADWDSYYTQKKFGLRMPMIDLSAVVFSPSDLARIEIPPFSRIEDQILGYCIKYWNSVNDPAFERILFLYSRKYGKKNYDVYMAIRRGRQAKNRDDEILSSIMGILVTGYYYSIQGDIYLQRNWNMIKHALTQQKSLPVFQNMPVTVPKQIEDRRPSEKTAEVRRPLKVRKAPGKDPGIGDGGKRTRMPKIAPKPRSKAAPRIAPKPLVLKGRPKAVVAKSAAAGQGSGAAVNPRPVKVPYKLKPAPEIKTTIVAKSTGRQKSTVPAARSKPAVRPTQRPAQPVVRPVQVPAAPPRPAAAWSGSAAAQPKPASRPVQVPAAPPRPAAAWSGSAAAQPKPASRPVQAPAAPPKPAAAWSGSAAAQPKPASRPVQAPAAQSKPAVPRPVEPPAPPKPAAQPKPLASAPPPRQTGYRPAPYVSASPPPARPKQKVFTPRTLVKAKGSVSDRLRELSGRSYDVYENRFLAKARNAIRKILGTGKGLFFNLPEEAEDLVYNFLRDHYSDPYMDWEDSAERRNLLEMGFDLPSILPVIDECYRAL
ncbi:MAG: hypothetical protein LBO65_08105 [Spirochaetaceae bacterium]|jgi:hypothetical protein|nr:hypothetical protein [Spirochaetaceae bacterium]